jgi:hypothetical protein
LSFLTNEAQLSFFKEKYGNLEHVWAQENLIIHLDVSLRSRLVECMFPCSDQIGSEIATTMEPWLPFLCSSTRIRRYMGSNSYPHGKINQKFHTGFRLKRNHGSKSEANKYMKTYHEHGQERELIHKKHA